MTTALRVEGVSKQYRIYERPGDRLKESLTRGRMKRHREFWALQEVSFEIEAGTTVGIVGPNGCGKSTLLQIIAGTLEPTHGDVWREGRVAALLELGAGFDPEFTGVENVHMNAALMGLTRRETERLLPEVERFAEIGPFIRQPVKTYSSGMYVRLAFAVAASVEPDILVIDEALAVGDAVFQHRCLRRIKEIQERGSTVLFVSHDAAAVRALCTRAVLLNAGRVVSDGKPSDVLNRYQKIIMEREQAFEEGEAAARAHVGDGHDEDETRAPLRYTSGVDDAVVGFLIRNRHGVHAYGTNTKEQQIDFGRVEPGETIEVSFAFNCWLGIDQYSVSLAVHSREGVSYDWLDGVLFFRVTSATLVEGVANLNASAQVRRLGAGIASKRDEAGHERAGEKSVTHG
ncbi:MAG: ABC transporter ATP-binding protein [Acidobacteria bacterium]|nr:ABC transporter ATP-binding protein [Acidobacteriota bacterium]